MANPIIPYILIVVAFIFGSIYNFIIRTKCIYSVKLTKTKVIVLVNVMVVFCIIAYMLENLWHNYPIAVLAGTLIATGVLGEGIHEKGIYYRPATRGGFIIRLARWEDVHSIELDDTQNKIKSFVLEGKKIIVSQVYKEDEIKKIENYIKNQKI